MCGWGHALAVIAGCGGTNNTLHRGWSAAWRGGCLRPSKARGHGILSPLLTPKHGQLRRFLLSLIHI